MNFAKQMENEQSKAGQLTCWIAIISLHQSFGIGAERIDRLAKYMSKEEDKNISLMLEKDIRTTDLKRAERLKGKCDPVFRVPMLRAPKGRKEQQLKMGRDTAATIAWQIIALACINVLGFGPERLDRLKKELTANYRQFLEESEIDQDWALERVRRCAEDAVKEGLRIVVDENNTEWDKYDREMESKKRIANRVKMSADLASISGMRHPGKDAEGEIYARCLAQTFGRR